MTLVLDHSMRQSFQTCETMFFLRYVCGLVRISDFASPGRDFGKSFHLATEVYDTTHCVNTAMGEFVNNFPDIPDRVRTPDRARELLEAYARFLRDENITFAGNPEVSFQVPLSNHLIHAGRIDRILSQGWPMEYKTTYYLYDANGLPTNTLDRWVGHNSLRGYAWVWKAPKVKILIFGVHPQKCKVAKTHLPSIQWQDIPMLDWELDLWHSQTLTIGEDILRKLGSQHIDPSLDNPWLNIERTFEHNLFPHWTMDTGACYNYNSRCQYKDLCVRGLPQGMVESMYEVQPRKPYEGL